MSIVQEELRRKHRYQLSKGHALVSRPAEGPRSGAAAAAGGEAE